jgi:predicted secreted Zn-dependent protease
MRGSQQCAHSHHEHVRRVFVELGQDVRRHDQRHAAVAQVLEQRRKLVPRFGSKPEAGSSRIKSPGE